LNALRPGRKHLPTLIAITGPIAAGATTLARHLVTQMTWAPLFEEDVETHNPFFACYHADPGRYTFHNQVLFLTKSAEAHRQLRTQACSDLVYIQDFCPFEHTEVYAYVQHQLGMLTDAEYEVLRRLTALLEPQYLVPTVLIYRPIRPEQLLQRVRERCRPSEQALKIEFLDALRRRFDEWATAWSRSPIIIVSADLDVQCDGEEVRTLGQTIEQQLWTHPTSVLEPVELW
jgi:deoxyadenosine/deoxycytidine kinase